MTTYDVVIIGGGMVGAALGCALGGSRYRVALLEQQHFVEPPADRPFDNRVSAITRASEHLLRRIGAWSGVTERRYAPYQRMQVWDSGSRGLIGFDSDELGEPNLGYIIENRVLLAALLARLQQFDNVTTIAPAQPLRTDRTASALQITLADGQQLTTRLLVGADGSDSWVRQQAAISSRGWAYDHHAITATITTSQPHRATAWQRFLASGPVAMLPLSDPHCCSLVWSTAPNHAADLMAAADSPFLDQLQQAFGNPLGRLLQVGPRSVTPLLLRHATRYCDHRIVLIGNAAHAIHPLAGQGLNLGLLDVAALAEILLAAQPQRRDPGDQALLRRYERWRKEDNLTVMAAMEGFKRLFGSRHPLLQLARGAGLSLTDRSVELKRWLLQRALGRGDDLPTLAQPPVSAI